LITIWLSPPNKSGDTVAGKKRAVIRQGVGGMASEVAKRLGQDIGFDLPSAARHAVIRPSGAGKTTLINLLVGMLRPDTGNVPLVGMPVVGMPVTILTPEKRVACELTRIFQISARSPN
jgi:ABC-type branched-subunit amino acid transport system ATPase component